MDAETIDRLTAQYVWAIQSDGAWYEPAKMYVANRQFGNFRRHTGNFIHKIRTLQQEALSEEERAFVIVTLWEQAGGKLEDCLSDPGLMRKEITALLDKGRKCHDGDYHRALEVPESAPHTSNPCSEISLHPVSAIFFQDCVACLETITKEKITMSLTTNPNVAIETKTVIFGQDASSMSEQQLIDAIKRVEGDIAKLKEVKTSSKKIASNIKELEAQLDAIVAVLDAR